jgi:hypothetical protein
MTGIYSTLRTGVLALKERTGLSMAQMMDGARLDERQINSRYLAKLSSGASQSRALATLNHLIQRHGALPQELLVPLFCTEEHQEAPADVPSSPYHDRMSQTEFELALQDRDYRIDDVNDPICQVLTVFARPKPDDERFKVLGVGRATVLAIEAGLNSPKALEVALANSPSETIAPLLDAAATLEAGRPLTSSRTMAVFVPPDVLITCALVTYLQRIDFLGVDAVGHYASAPAVSRARKPGDQALAGPTARILSATDFPLPL